MIFHPAMQCWLEQSQMQALLQQIAQGIHGGRLLQVTGLRDVAEAGVCEVPRDYGAVVQRGLQGDQSAKQAGHHVVQPGHNLCNVQGCGCPDLGGASQDVPSCKNGLRKGLQR